MQSVQRSCASDDTSSGKAGCLHWHSGRICSLVACLNHPAKLSCLAQLLFCACETLTLEKSPYYRLPHGSELSQSIWHLSFLAPPLVPRRAYEINH